MKKKLLVILGFLITVFGVVAAGHYYKSDLAERSKYLRCLNYKPEPTIRVTYHECYEPPQALVREELDPSVATSDWQTYTNTEYGFELDFPPSWEGYIISPYKLGGVRVGDDSVMPQGIDFALQTWSSGGGENPEALAVMLSISIYPKFLRSYIYSDHTYLAENDDYIFAYLLSTLDGVPTPQGGYVIDNPNIEQAKIDIYKIPKTFRLVRE